MALSWRRVRASIVKWMREEKRLAQLTEKDGLERPQHANSERDRRELFAQHESIEVNVHSRTRLQARVSQSKTHERDDPVNRSVGGEREPEERDRAQDDAVQAFPEVLLRGRSSTELFRLAAVVAACVETRACLIRTGALL